jgi:acetolactate synthase-1/2/3 large subunit
MPTIAMDSFGAMEGMGIHRILTDGEKAAVYMADGYGRAARRPGVCMAPHIGASNLARRFTSTSPIAGSAALA